MYMYLIYFLKLLHILNLALLLIIFVKLNNVADTLCGWVVDYKQFLHAYFNSVHIMQWNDNRSKLSFTDNRNNHASNAMPKTKELKCVAYTENVQEMLNQNVFWKHQTPDRKIK